MFSNNLERKIKIKTKTMTASKAHKKVTSQENQHSYSRQFVLCLTTREPKNATSIVLEKGIIFAYNQKHRRGRTKPSTPKNKNKILSIRSITQI